MALEGQRRLAPQLDLDWEGHISNLVRHIAFKTATGRTIDSSLVRPYIVHRILGYLFSLARGVTSITKLSVHTSLHIPRLARRQEGGLLYFFTDGSCAVAKLALLEI